MNTELVLANIGKYINLNRTEVDFFLSLLTARELKRKDFLLKAGEICNRLNYVNTGSLRAFYRDEADKETTQMFAISDGWITDMPCFINQQPAMVYIEAIPIVQFSN